MLDLNHPQTKYIFQAARIEDKIRAHLLLLQNNVESLSDEEKSAIKKDILENHIVALENLNLLYFCNSKAIQSSLNHLKNTILKNDVNEMWNVFLKLANSQNAGFATWAI